MAARHSQRPMVGMALAGLAMLAGCASAPGSDADSAKLRRIQNIVVFYAENHSFDNLYGLFPGANGIGRATPEQMTQLDHDGKPLAELLTFGRDGKPDPAYPRLPNKPFRIDAPPVNRPPTVIVPSPIHDYFYNQEQVSGSRNNVFAAMSQVGGWSMGHYDGSRFLLWQWARQYTLADNFFQGAFGGSFLNHQWLVCACTPQFPDAPDTMRVRLDADGKLPAVSFYKPAGRDTQHPSCTGIMSGDAHIAGVLEKLRASPQRKDMLVVVTYDENGGYRDHVPPPSGPGWGDRWRPGTRVPAIIVGPNVKRGPIDSTGDDTTSILQLITQRFRLALFPGVRANAGNLAAALQ